MTHILCRTVSSNSQFLGRLRFPIKPTAVALMALAVFSAPAQTQRPPAAAAHTAPKKAAFEVTSIRLEGTKSSVVDYNDPTNVSNQPQKYPANRLVWRHVMMRSLICGAYAVDCGNLKGLPAQMDSNATHYDLNAKVEGDAMLTFAQMEPMLQTMLEERFHLVVHHEHKIVPGYALVVAKGGPKLTPYNGGPLSGQFMGGGEFKIHNEPTDNLAALIGFAIKQTVINKTGLGGAYDIDLKFSPENVPVDSPLANRPTIFTALQEQLGLRLVPQKVPQDYLVVDHVDRIPTEN